MEEADREPRRGQAVVDDLNRSRSDRFASSSRPRADSISTSSASCARRFRSSLLSARERPIADATVRLRREMSALGPHLAVLAALTTCCGVALIRFGSATGQLRERVTVSRCPCCGRARSRRGCRHCGI